MSERIRWIIFGCLLGAAVNSHMRHAVTAEALRIVSVSLGHTTEAINALERRISDLERKTP
jgi:hypothetical protein